MANIGPKKKVSRSRTKRRHAAWQRVNLVRISQKYAPSTCSNCGKAKLSHRACPHCGFYNGKQVISINTKGSSNVIAA